MKNVSYGIMKASIKVSKENLGGQEMCPGGRYLCVCAAVKNESKVAVEIPGS